MDPLSGFSTGLLPAIVGLTWRGVYPWASIAETSAPRSSRDSTAPRDPEVAACSIEGQRQRSKEGIAVDPSGAH